MVATEYKGWEGKFYRSELGAASSAYDEIGQVQSFSITLDNAIVPFHICGQRKAYSVKEGSQTCTGTFEGLFIDASSFLDAAGFSSKTDYVGINKSGATHIIYDVIDQAAVEDYNGGNLVEIESTDYDMIEADDATLYSTTTGANTNYAQQVFKFDNIGTDTNITALRFHHSGFNSASAGTEGLTFKVWDANGAAWVALTTTTNTTTGLTRIDITNTTNITNWIDGNNDLYITCYTTDVTSGAKTIQTDYVALYVQDSTKVSYPPTMTFKGVLNENWASSNTVTVVVTDVKLNTWGTTITSGETVLQNVDWVGILSSIA